MWFLSARKNRRNQSARSQRGTFRPQLEGLEDRCLMSAGALDPTFGSGGLVTLPNFIASGTGGAVVVQPDGKIVAGGYISSQFALARYTTSGTLDPSFGTNGIVMTSVGAQIAFINGLALQSNGDIVAVGSATTSVKQGKKTVSYDAFAVARYNPNGSLDTTFGGTGVVTTNVCVAQSLLIPGDILMPGAKAVAIQADGKIVVAGGVSTGTSLTDTEFALTRYNVSGSLDTAFGSGGIVITPQFGNNPDEATSLVIQADANILVAGGTFKSGAPQAMAVVRYTPTGQQDSSFGSNGIVTGLAPAGSIAVARGILELANGEIVAGGWSHSGSSYTPTMARLTSSGQLDSTFGNAGFAISPINGKAWAITQGPNGDLLAPCTAYDSTNDFGVVAFLPTGAVDTTFGSNGATTADFSGGNDSGFGIALQGDGKIVVAGTSNHSSIYLALARFLPPDTKIGSFTATPNPVTANNPVTLTTSNILNANPTSTITQVAFYLDANGDGILETGIDTLLGYGTNNSGVWTFTFTPTTSGAFTLFALATDSNGILSDPVAVTLNVL